MNVRREEEPAREPPPAAGGGVEERQREKLRLLKASRDGGRVREALWRVREAARTEENLLPPILAAVKAYATVGEICGVLREEFGEYRETTG